MTLPYLGFDDLPKPPDLNELYFPLQHEPPPLENVERATQTFKRPLMRTAHQPLRADSPHPPICSMHERGPSFAFDELFSSDLAEAEKALDVAEAAIMWPKLAKEFTIRKHTNPCLSLLMTF